MLSIERGIVISYETMRRWAIKFGADYGCRQALKSPRAAANPDGLSRAR
jgi:transposase-like protein